MATVTLAERMTGQPREYGQSNTSAELQNVQENTEIWSANRIYILTSHGKILNETKLYI